MTRWFLISGCSLAALLLGLTVPSGHAATPAPKAQSRDLVKVNLLPLALDDTFSFRKNQLFLNDPSIHYATRDSMISFERQRLNYGALTNQERRARYGNYFSFWWRATRETRLTVRLEYRQQNLGSHVLAKEVDFQGGKGTHQTKFEVTGDDYLDDGRVIAWRALLIENGKIVALTQSALWH